MVEAQAIAGLVKDAPAYLSALRCVAERGYLFEGVSYTAAVVRRYVMLDLWAWKLVEHDLDRIALTDLGRQVLAELERHELRATAGAGARKVIRGGRIISGIARGLGLSGGRA